MMGTITVAQSENACWNCETCFVEILHQFIQIMSNMSFIYLPPTKRGKWRFSLGSPKAKKCNAPLVVTIAGGRTQNIKSLANYSQWFWDTSQRDTALLEENVQNSYYFVFF